MADQSPFLKTLIGASKSAKDQGWPGTFDPLKTVNDTFNSVMSGANNVGQGIGSGVQNVGKSIGDFSNMAQGNLGAVQSGLQGLGHQLFGAKTPGSSLPRGTGGKSSMLSIPTYPAKTRTRKSKKATR